MSVNALQPSGLAAADRAKTRQRPHRVATWIMLGVTPVVCALLFFSSSYADGKLAYDFRNAYLPAAEAVLDGESPYVGLDDPRLEAETAYVYPPPLAYALIPLTTLSENAASVLVTVLGAVLLAGALGLLQVRDWRCYGAAFLWAPTLVALNTGSSSVLLAFGCALAWRFRDRLWEPAAAIGLSIAVKLFVWPLLVWTLATRRVAVTTGALVVGIATVFAGWAALGFADLGRYPLLLRRLADLEASDSYSLVGVGATLGLGDAQAQALALAVGGALLAACAIYGRAGDDVRSFTAAIGAALAFTPIVWQHYLVLLLVPLAIARPRFSALWLLPVFLFWLIALPGWPVEPRPFVAAGVSGIVIIRILMRSASTDAPRAQIPVAAPEGTR